jgi:hypothetical protein
MEPTCFLHVRSSHMSDRMGPFLLLSQAEAIYHLAGAVPGPWGSVTCLSPLIELFWSLGKHLESRKRPERESDLFICTHKGQVWGWGTCLSSSHRTAVSLDKTRASCTGNGSRSERSGSAGTGPSNDKQSYAA